MCAKWRVGYGEADALAAFVQKKAKIDSARRVKSHINNGFVTVNGVVERFYRSKVKQNDLVTLKVPSVVESAPWDAEERILYEDDFFFIYNKPPKFTCDERAEKMFSAHLLHRLDKDTTGVLLFAKNKVMQEALFEQFKNREVEKEYVAIVDGIVGKESGKIENFFTLASSYEGTKIWKVTERADEKSLFAETNFCVQARGHKATFIRLFPHTGRTHQLRLHMAYIKHPILADPLYGHEYVCKKQAPRLMLHAEKVRFFHPEKKKIVEVIAPIPDDFSSMLQEVL